MRKSKIIKNQKEYIEKLNNEIEEKEEDILEKYRYGILVDKDYKVKVWNDGRFEPSVKSVSFESDEYGPTLTIWK